MSDFVVDELFADLSSPLDDGGVKKCDGHGGIYLFVLGQICWKTSSPYLTVSNLNNVDRMIFIRSRKTESAKAFSLYNQSFSSRQPSQSLFGSFSLFVGCLQS
jgi:hypothetical protein